MKFSIGSDKDDWPGLAKVIEECSEVIHEGAKIIATDGTCTYADGSTFDSQAFWDECADLSAALSFLLAYNQHRYDLTEYMEHTNMKIARFEGWRHDEGQTETPPLPYVPGERNE